MVHHMIESLPVDHDVKVEACVSFLDTSLEVGQPVRLFWGSSLYHTVKPLRDSRLQKEAEEMILAEPLICRARLAIRLVRQYIAAFTLQSTC